jgi:hypothetical protein
LRLFGILVFSGLLSIEKIGVGAELEDEIENIKNKKDYGSAVREDQYVLVCIFFGTSEGGI